MRIPRTLAGFLGLALFCGCQTLDTNPSDVRAARSPNSVLSQLGVRGVTTQGGSAAYRDFLVKTDASGKLDVSVLPGSVGLNAPTDIIVVDSKGSDDLSTANGSISRPFRTFAFALAQASDDTTFLFAPGAYTLDAVTDPNIVRIALVGFDPDGTVLSGTLNLQHNVDTTVTLSGVTVGTVRQGQYRDLTVHLRDDAHVTGLINRQYPTSVNSVLTVLRDPSAVLDSPISTVNSSEVLTHSLADIAYYPSAAADWAVLPAEGAPALDYLAEATTNLQSQANALREDLDFTSNTIITVTGQLWTAHYNLSNSFVSATQDLWSAHMSDSNNLVSSTQGLWSAYTAISNDYVAGTQELWSAHYADSNSMVSATNDIWGAIYGTSNGFISATQDLWSAYVGVSNDYVAGTQALWTAHYADSNNFVAATQDLWSAYTGVSNAFTSGTQDLWTAHVADSNNLITATGALWSTYYAISNAFTSSTQNLWSVHVTATNDYVVGTQMLWTAIYGLDAVSEADFLSLSNDFRSSTQELWTAHYSDSNNLSVASNAFRTDITALEAREEVPTGATQGGILYWNGIGWTELPKTSDGLLLASGSIPTWEAPASIFSLASWSTNPAVSEVEMNHFRITNLLDGVSYSNAASYGQVTNLHYEATNLITVTSNGLLDVISTSVDDRVAIAGDDMTGPLVINAGTDIALQAYNDGPGEVGGRIQLTPAATEYGQGLGSVSQNDPGQDPAQGYLFRWVSSGGGPWQIHDDGNFVAGTDYATPGSVSALGIHDSGVDTEDPAGTSRTITFNKTFASAPVVVITLAEDAGFQIVTEITATTATTCTYQLRGAVGLLDDSHVVNWVAIGVAPSDFESGPQ